MQEKLQMIVEINRQLKEFEDTKKKLQKELIEEGFKKGEYDGAKVGLTTRVTPKLKESVDITELELKYPQFLKFDTTSFAKSSVAEDYIEFSETSYLTIKEGKK